MAGLRERMTRGMHHALTPLRSLSIRGGLAGLALLAVLPALALQVHEAALERDHLVKEAIQDAQRAAGSLAQIQTRITDGTRILLSTLAVMPQVRKLEIPACAALFASLRQQHPIYLNILAVDRNGEIVASALPAGRLNLSDRKHIKTAMADDTFAAGEYIVSRMAFEPAFPFAFPIHDDSGAIAGLLLATIRLSAYDAMFDQLTLPEKSILGIADCKGTRLYYRPQSDAFPPGRPVRPEVWRTIADQGGDTGGALLEGANGNRRYFAWAKARLTPQAPPYMIFIVGVPETAFLARARQSLVRSVVLLVGVAGLALGVAWFVGGPAIARRLDRIAATADRIGRGDLNARTAVAHGENGIGKVAKTIDAMAELLAANDAARNRALAALRQSQERMAHITASMADWIWEIDAEDKYRYASPQVRGILGFEPEALYGHTPYAFMAPDEQARTRAVFEAVKARREPLRDMAYWNLTRDGQTRCLLANGVPWHDETGAYRGYRGVSKDITERVRAEDEIRESLRDKEILLKEIHHRVKNNLQIISGLLYLQEEQVTDRQALEAFRISRHRIASMALVHEELYRSSDLSRVCLGQYTRDLLPRLFGDAAADPRIERRLALGDVRVPIEQAVPSGLIINELLTNAYKYAFNGRERGVLTISVNEAGDAVEIVIRDDGPGLPEGLVPERATTLGMQLVCNLTRQLRGSLTARNDGGAVFTLRFPRRA